jgi:predicted metal-dependent phosphoesterase TrpH
VRSVRPNGRCGPPGRRVDSSLIDLHTHTTASDGRLVAADLVARAAAAGVTVLAVTDHDTIGGCEAAESACRSAGIAFVNGIEVTAARDDSDVHVLAYFFDRTAPALLEFLAEQRRRRIDRVRQMVARLETHRIHLDAEAIVGPALDDPSQSAGRPWIARALVTGGFVKNTNEAFDRWLTRGKPAYVPRAASSPRDVFARIHAAGGIVSLAHPLLVGHDEWLEEFAADGLDALEAYHSDHDAATTAHYLQIARRLGLAVSGGSDFHGDPSHGPRQPGDVSLPQAEYDRLRQLRA